MNSQPESRPYFIMLFYFFLIWFGFTMVFGGVIALLEGTEYSPEQLIKGENYKNGFNALLYKGILSLQTFVLFVIPSIAFTVMSREKFFQFFQLNTRPNLRLFVLTPIVIASAAPLIFGLYEINQMMELPAFMQSIEETMKEMEKQGETTYKVLLYMPDTTSFILSIIIVGVLPAIGEELMFRGGIQKLVHGATGNAHIAILFSGIFFSFIHFQFYGFYPRLAMGMLFGYLFYWSGSLWMPILGHFIFNSVQVISAYYSGEANGEETESITQYPMWLIGGAVLFAVSTYLYYKIGNNNSTKEEFNGEGLG